MKIVESDAQFQCYSRACVRVRMDVSEWFPVNVGLGQGCLMYIYVYIYIYVCEDGCGATGKCREAWEWAGLPSANDGRFEINQLLFADVQP